MYVRVTTLLVNASNTCSIASRTQIIYEGARRRAVCALRYAIAESIVDELHRAAVHGDQMILSISAAWGSGNSSNA